MSRKFRQLTNFFTTGPFDAAAATNALQSNSPANTNPQIWTWNGFNIWSDLNSGRNVLVVSSGMTLRITDKGEYTLSFQAAVLVERAVVVHKFDAYDNANKKLFTIVTRPLALSAQLNATAPSHKLRGSVEEIDTVADLNLVEYFGRRGAGEYCG